MFLKCGEPIATAEFLEKTFSISNCLCPFVKDWWAALVWALYPVSLICVHAFVNTTLSWLSCLSSLETNYHDTSALLLFSVMVSRVLSSFHINSIISLSISTEYIAGIWICTESVLWVECEKKSASNPYHVFDPWARAVPPMNSAILITSLQFSSFVIRYVFKYFMYPCYWFKVSNYNCLLLASRRVSVFCLLFFYPVALL